MADESPQVGCVSLKLRLGELTLGEFRRELLIHPATPFDGRKVLSCDGALEKAPPGAQGVLFRSLPVSSRLPKLSLGRSAIRYVPRQYDRQFADLSTTYDAYLATFSTKSRSTLRRKVRHFEKESGGSIDYRCYKTREDVERFYGLAREISAQSYQERLLDAGLPNEAKFLADALEAADRGNVRAYLIFLGEKPIAYLYCPTRDGIVSYAYLGYRAEHSELSPGTVLLWLVMEDLFREGVHRIFDFTEGGDRSRHSQKRLFATANVACADVYVFRWAASNIVVVLVHSAIDILGSSIGSVLERMALKSKVRLWTRKLLGKS